MLSAGYAALSAAVKMADSCEFEPKAHKLIEPLSGCFHMTGRDSKLANPIQILEIVMQFNDCWKAFSRVCSRATRPTVRYLGSVKQTSICTLSFPASCRSTDLVGDRVNDAAAVVQVEFGFQNAEKSRENWRGREAELFRAEDGAWHFMTSDGLIRRWTTPGKAEGRVVAAVNPVFYDSIDLLFSAANENPEGQRRMNSADYPETPRDLS